MLQLDQLLIILKQLRRLKEWVLAVVFKSVVMIKRLQAAREKMVAVHAHETELKPVILRAPFMDQEFDIPSACDGTECGNSARCGARHQAEAR